MSIKTRFAVTIFAGAAALPLALPASPAATNAQDQQEERPQVVTRVYSLRPLVAEARQQAAVQSGTLTWGRGVTNPGDPAGGVISGTAFGEGDAQSANEVVSQVTSIITATVDPDNWLDNGGTIGTITYLPINSRLIVTHTAEVHQRVAQLIDELQDREVLSIQARLIRLPVGEVDRHVQVSEGVAVWEGDPADLPIVAQVRFSGFDGQVQHASQGTSFGYFESVQPIVAANAVGYQPTTGELQTGLTLRVTPILSVDSASATLEVDARYALLEDYPEAGAAVVVEPQLQPATQPSDSLSTLALASRLAVAGISQPVVPDRLRVHRRVLETSLRIPVGRWVLLGTLGSSSDGQPTEEDPMHLLIRLDAGRGE